ncbi:MAG: two-component system response regulator [Cycloclasticus sp. symbiont of Poecilosclerida sp. M]|nr:MAG: two-component system response regulator [Cycloclasticus sp. symbiont of Poecilosclerida sp. M]
MIGHAKRLMLIDDDEVLCDTLCNAFTRRGFEVKTACDQVSAEKVIESFCPELAVVDLRLGQSSGLHIIKLLKQKDENTKIVMLTGFANIATAVEAVKLGAMQYITKPANVDEILSAFDKIAPDVDTVPPEQPLSVKRLEWEHMHQVLQLCDGNISQAARLLNMHRRTLQRKLAKKPVRS